MCVYVGHSPSAPRVCSSLISFVFVCAPLSLSPSNAVSLFVDSPFSFSSVISQRGAPLFV